MAKEPLHNAEDEVEDPSSLHPEESAFYIAEEDRIDTTTGLLKDPTDFTDTVKKEQARRNTRRWAVALGIFAAVVLVLGLIISSFLNNKNDVPPPAPKPTAPTATQAPNTKDPGVVTNPLLDGYKDAPKVTAGEVLVQVEGNTVRAGEKTIAFVASDQVKAPNTPCKVTQPTDFCLAARGVSGEKPFDLYYLKDAAHSRLFENPSTFKKLTVANSPSAAILPLQMGGAKLPTAVIVNTDSSGWMIVTQESDPVAVEAFVKTVTVR